MEINTAERLQGIEEYYFSQKLREIELMNASGKKVINLGIGSPDLPPHPDVIKTLYEEALNQNRHGYQSYKGAPALRKAFSDWYQKWYHVTLDSNTEVLPLIGSKEGILHICMTYLNQGDEVLIPNPGYPTYTSAVKLTGASCVDYELLEEHSYYPDFGALEKKDLRKVKLMFVNYPNMPTGQLPTKELFENLVRFARKHNILIVHDNPYSFILNETPVSLLQIEGAKDVVLELNSLSKSHNMAGWRVGVICGAKQRVEEILRFKSNMDSGMFLPVQLAAAKALSLEKNWHDELNKIYKSRRDKVFELLDLIKCEYSKKQVGLFVWARISNQYTDGYALSDKILSQANVFITPGGIFGSVGKNYVRISLCSSEDKICEAIERVGRCEL